MSRDLTSGVAAQLTADSVYPFFLLQLNLASSSLYLYSGFGDLVWDSKTWLGNGYFTGIGDYKESSEITSASMDVTLTGISQAMISLMLSQTLHSNTGQVYLGFLDSTGAIISDPYLLFSGALDSPQIEDSPEGASITISIDGALVWLNRGSELRYTNESQQALFPGDRGFEYIIKLDNWTGYWGNKKKKADTKKKKSTKTKDKSARK